MIYVNALIVVAAASITANVILSGLLVRWIRFAKYWEHRYDDATAPVVPVDPYEPLNYPWKEEWD